MAGLTVGIRAEVMGNVATGMLPDSHAAGRRTMNGFAIASSGEIARRYAGLMLNRNPKKGDRVIR
jgi:hypothetical protein